MMQLYGEDQRKMVIINYGNNKRWPTHPEHPASPLWWQFKCFLLDVDPIHLINNSSVVVISSIYFQLFIGLFLLIKVTL